jgi:glutamine---fructose-6-phosphate transaminase (isomerizing)
MGDRADAFLDDVLAAPDELAAVLGSHARSIAALPTGILARSRWRLIGMGSSRFAALDAAAGLRAAGLDAVAESASASEPGPAGHDTLAIVISSSGRTPEVLAAAERHRGSSLVLALTGSTGTPLAEGADAVMPLVAGRGETAGIASLSYRSTVAALAFLVDVRVGAAPGGGLEVAVPALETLIRHRAAWLDAAADVLDAGREVHVLGDGARIGSLEQGALMLREAPRIPAHAFDTGEWLHVGLYTLFPGDPVVLFTGSPADDEAIATIRARGGRVVTVGAAHDGADAHVMLPEAVLSDGTVRALVEPAVAELLGAELWRRAAAVVRGDERR